MRSEPHPLTGAVYTKLEEGGVRVQKADSASYGIFTWRGEWLEGDITQADLHMLGYIGGPDLPADHEVFWMSTQAVVHDGSIPMQAPPGAHMSEMPRIIAPYQADHGTQTPAGMRSAGHMELEVFLNNDRRPDLIPDAFHKLSPMPGGPSRVRTDRFHKKDFHDREVERIWKRTWQVACREDDIPNAGDYHVYEIAHLSFLIVRTNTGEIKAFPNICLHRGRLLKDCSGRGAKELRCPFHGWSWNLDGSLKEITTAWDFPGVADDVAALPSVKTSMWGGFVFINPDIDAAPLEEFMGPVMLDHYRKYKLENRYKQAHVEKIIRANWKVAMEAFMESYHVIATHPHQMLIGGDLSNTRYDVFGNWGRAGHIAMSNPGSPQRGLFVTEEQALQYYWGYADMQRDLLHGMIGDEVEQFSDAELTDTGTFCDLFPNFHPWSGWTRICFRFRPHGDNPDESIMDVMLLAPWPEGKPKPPPAKLRRLGVDEAWTSAPEIMSLSKIMDQDVGNLAAVQAGLKAKDPPFIWYSAYQEGKIRNFHRNYEKAMGLEAGA